MSLMQWFENKIRFNKPKNQTNLITEKAGDFLITSELNDRELHRARLHENIWLTIFSVTIALWLLPALFLIPRLIDYADATTWSIIEDIETTNDTGYMSSIAINGSNFPAVVYFDNTALAVKYAVRTAGGTWTVEQIETMTFAYTNGRFAIAKDPTDSKMSAIYCLHNGGSGGLLRYAHRKGDGTGNCGTSNNWQCSTAVSFSAGCPGRIMSNLIFHPTSSQPTFAYTEDATNDTLKYLEYNGSSWTATAVSSSAKTFYLEPAALIYSSTTSQPSIIYHENGHMNHMYRDNSTWVWTLGDVIVEGLTDPTSGGLTYPNATLGYNNNFEMVWSGGSGGVFSGNKSGNTAWTTSTAISGGGTYQWNNLAFDSTNTRLGLVTYDFGNGNLIFVSKSSPTWGSAETVSSTNDVGYEPSLVFYQGNPVISYNDTTHGNMSFISAASTFGNQAPTAPTTPYSNSSTAQSGLTNPTNLATGTPAFSAIFNDPDASDTGNQGEIEVTTTTDSFATITHWDSGQTSISTAITNGARSGNIFYGYFGTAPTKSIGIADDSTEDSSNTTYYWRIRFWDGSGSAGTWSDTQSFSILDKPRAPTGVSATFSASTSTINWTDNSSVEDYFEARISTDNSTYSHAASSTTSGETSTSTAGLSPNTLYYIKMYGYNAAGYSSASTATSGYTLANAPTSVTATSSASDRAQIVWNSNSNTASTEYYVLNVTAGTNSGWNSNTNYTFTGLTPSKTYTFQTKARNGNHNETAYSSTVSTSTVPNAPTNMTFSEDGSTVIVTWSANSNSSEAYYRLENTTTGEITSWTTQTSYTYYSLIPGNLYAFRVQALGPDGTKTSYLTGTYNVQGSGGGGSSGDNGDSSGGSSGQSAEKYHAFIDVADYAGNNRLTSSTKVLITLDVSSNITEVVFSNSPGFENTTWQSATKRVYYWDLVAGNGSRTVYAKFKTDKGTITDVAADSITLDVMKPNAPTITTPRDFSELTIDKPSIAGFAESYATISIDFFDKKTKARILHATTEADDKGAWSYNPQISLGGEIQLVARAIDGIGNISDPTTISFTIADNTPPVDPAVLFPETNAIITTSTFDVVGTAEPLAKIVIVRDRVLTYTTTVGTDGRWLFKIPVPFENGEHAFMIFAVDSSGNSSNGVYVPFVIKIEETLVMPPPEQPMLPELPIEIQKQTPPEQPSHPLVRGRMEAPTSPVTGGIGESSGSGGQSTSGSGLGGPSASASGESSGGGMAQATGGGVSGGSTAIAIEAAGGTQATSIGQVIDSFQKAIDAGGSVLVATQQAIFEGTAVAAKQVVKNTKVAAKIVAKTTVRSAKVVREVSQKPEVQTANKVVVVPTTAAVAAASAGSVMNFGNVLVYFRFLFTQPLYLITRKRRRGWGVVYNAITKMPIDLAVVRLVDVVQNKVVRSRVTDQSGRYQFSVEPGEYKIEVTKPSFTFPPEYLKGKTEDGKYTDLYIGATLKFDAPAIIVQNIPIDPVGIDKPTGQLLKEAIKKQAAAIASVGGLVVTVVSFVITPTLIVGLFLGGHLASFFLFRRLAKTKLPKSWGLVHEVDKKEPLPKSVVRIFDTQYNKLLETQVTDTKGRYGFLVGKNEYYLMVDKFGFEQFVSQPMPVEDKGDGAILAPDVGLRVKIGEVVATTTAAQSSAVAQPTTVVSAEVPSTAVAAASIVSNVALKPNYVPKEFIPTSDILAKPTVASALLQNLEIKKQTTVAPVDITGIVGANDSSITRPTQDGTYKQAAFIPSVPAFSTDRKAFVDKVNQKISQPYLIGAKSLAARLLTGITSGSRDMVITGLPKEAGQFHITDNGNLLQAANIDKFAEKVVTTDHFGDLLAATQTVEKRLHNR